MDVKDRNNMACYAAGEGMWGFGWNLAAPLTVLPLLIARIGGSNLEVGLIATISAAGMLFPQVLSSFILQRGGGRKRFLIVYHFLVPIPCWLLLGLATFFLAGRHPVHARVAIPVLFAAFTFSIGFIVPVWLDWMAGIFGRGVRGRAFGWASGASAMGGALAAVVAGTLTRVISFPGNYAVLFLFGTAFYVASMFVLIHMNEEGAERPGRRMRRSEIIARFRHSLAQSNYRRYLVSRLLLTAGGGAIAFFAVHYKSAEGGAITEQTVITLGATLWFSQAVTAFGLGRLGDALGHRLGAILGAAAQLAGLFIAVFIPGALSCVAVFALTGASFASAWVSHQNFLFETCPHDCRMAHITISNLVLAPLATLVPVLTGKLVEVFGTSMAFGACLVPTVLGFIWLLVMVKDPRSLRLVRERPAR